MNKVTLNNEKDHGSSDHEIQRRPKSLKKNMSDDEINEGLRKFHLTELTRNQKYIQIIVINRI